MLKIWVRMLYCVLIAVFFGAGLSNTLQANDLDMTATELAAFAALFPKKMQAQPVDSFINGILASLDSIPAVGNNNGAGSNPQEQQESLLQDLYPSFALFLYSYLRLYSQFTTTNSTDKALVYYQYLRLQKLHDLLSPKSALNEDTGDTTVLYIQTLQEVITTKEEDSLKSLEDILKQQPQYYDVILFLYGLYLDGEYSSENSEVMRWVKNIEVLYENESTGSTRSTGGSARTRKASDNLTNNLDNSIIAFMGLFIFDNSPAAFNDGGSQRRLLIKNFRAWRANPSDKSLKKAVVQVIKEYYDLALNSLNGTTRKFSGLQAILQDSNTKARCKEGKAGWQAIAEQLSQGTIVSVQVPENHRPSRRTPILIIPQDSSSTTSASVLSPAPSPLAMASFITSSSSSSSNTITSSSLIMDTPASHEHSHCCWFSVCFRCFGGK